MVVGNYGCLFIMLALNLEVGKKGIQAIGWGSGC